MTSSTLARLLCASVLAVALAAAAAAASAQSDPCAEYTCIDTSWFSATPDGWAPGLYTELANVPSMTTSGGALWWGWTSTASGVLQVRNGASIEAEESIWPDPEIRKTLTLAPGSYRVIYRASYPFTPAVRVEADNAHGVTVSPALPTCEYSSPGRRFNQCTEPVFYVDRAAALVTVVISFPELLPEPLDPALAALDFVAVVQVSGYYPTPNPATPTRAPGSTALPAATPRCVSRATPTPAYYGSATPTPAPDNDLAFLERFNAGPEWSQYWQPSTGFVFLDAPNHGITTQGYGASVGMTFSAAGSDPVSGHGLILSVTSARALYLDGFVLAPAIPAGTSAAVIVWRYDGATWAPVSSHPASSGVWHPFGASIPAGAQAVGLTVTRSDGNLSETVSIDDLYIYNSLAYRQFCDGAYPAGPGGSSIDGAPNLTDPGAGVGNWTILYPENKDCPPAIRVPNNFWGPILAGVTVWIDTLYADSPSYTVGRLPDFARAMLRPFTLVVGIVGAFINLDALWFVVQIAIPVAVFLLIRSVWLFFLETLKG